MANRIPASWRYPIKVLSFVVGIVFLCLLVATFKRNAIAGSFSSAFIFGTVQNFEAFLISLWSALAFFCAVGIAVLVIGYRRPEDDIIEARLSYLFSSSKFTSDVQEYTKNQVTKLSAFCESMDMKFFILEARSASNDFKMSTEGTLVFQNCFHNHPYADQADHLVVFADEIEGENTLGMVESARIFAPEGIAWELENRTLLTAADQRIKVQVPLKIGPDSRATFTYAHWTWNSGAEGYRFTTQRFCRKASATIENCSLDPLTVTFNDGVEKPEEKKIELQPGESCPLISNVRFTSDDAWHISVELANATSPD